MQDKKKVIILVIIALILALTAIALNIMDSNKIPVTKSSSQEELQGGEVGVAIQPPSVEDKLAEKRELSQ